MDGRTVIKNDSHLLKEVSKKLISALKARNVHEDIIFDIHVAFEEALRNAMIHGNKDNPVKKVIIDIEWTDGTVMLTVEDEGDGFDPDSLPDPTLSENLLKERGRGVYLMKHLMDGVTYQNEGRKVIMIKYLNRKHL